MTLKTRTILGSSNKARETTTATSIKKFPVNAPQKTPVKGKKKKPQKLTQVKKKKKLHKGKKKQCTRLHAACQALKKCDFSVYLCNNGEHRGKGSLET